MSAAAIRLENIGRKCKNKSMNHASFKLSDKRTEIAHHPGELIRDLRNKMDYIPLLRTINISRSNKLGKFHLTKVRQSVNSDGFRKVPQR